MSRLIDADALEKDGWMMHRTVRVDKDIMSYQTKKPTDFPTIEPAHGTGYRDGYKRGKRAGYKKGRNAGRKKGKWTKENACEFCGFQPWFERDIHTLSFCPNCGADMREGEQ